ncbi:2-hydroxyacid dehydrogenase [Anaerobacillus isosaccharinicus]|uniref:3-phosphoglycerate dehydrogenase n=1 Tax=Anaerobacillus isosaccharinicus TaxID=1532552 RepID=A0A1S2L4U7_9BACI|nr:2-hydroxyacid dehydrogenase [Anaerobacillus isosaccharinicus]MBA5588312.1 hypothetical protein [Anaerobacillus isosaccharinicus]QOY38252.1 hypothetical protein AWH56_012345 [Anaerobacillus isosaccharinicus]
MANKTILYFDKVFGDFKNILREQVPVGFDLLFWSEMNTDEQNEILSKADYLLVATEKIDQSKILKARNAKLIQKTGIGVDNIDIEFARLNQLPVANTPGANSTGVAELTILLILALYRKLTVANQATKDGEWLMWELRPNSFEMEGKTHGFIGFGNIGREAARRSQAFGTNIIYYDKFRASKEQEKALNATYKTLEEVLIQSDIISLHVPLLPETTGLIGMKELQLMKENAVLINVSRGGIVNEEDLYHAIKGKLIAGAGVDVWDTEPPKPNHPLLTLDNVIATPHLGAGTRDTLSRVLKMCFENIVRVESGEKPNFVVNNSVEMKKL